jgi:hypothetical protein
VTRSVGIATCLRFALNTLGLKFWSKEINIFTYLYVMISDSAQSGGLPPKCWWNLMLQGVTSSQNLKSHKQTMMSRISSVFPPFYFDLPSSWTVRGSNPGGSEIFRTLPDRPMGPSNLLYDGYRVFLGGKTVGAWR